MSSPTESSTSSVDPSPSATWEERQQFDAASIDRQTLGRLFPEFKIFDRIHHGGFGAVYVALLRRTRQWVALKVLSKSAAASAEGFKAFQEDVERVGGLRLNGFAQILASGERNGIVFLVQEWLDGVDLETLTSHVPQLPLGVAAEIMGQVAELLSHAHKQGLRHQELRPANVVLLARQEGTPDVKVLNLGLARLSEGEVAGFKMNMSGKFRGSLDYLAPEQMDRPREVDERADIYGVGATLYRMLTGQSPHGKDSANDTPYQKVLKITREEIPDVRTLRPDLPEEVAKILAACLARRKEDRPASLSDVVDMLKPYRSTSGLHELNPMILQHRRRLPVLPEPPSAEQAGPAIPMQRQPTLRWAPALMLIVVAIAVYAAWRIGLFY